MTFPAGRAVARASSPPRRAAAQPAATPSTTAPTRNVPRPAFGHAGTVLAARFGARGAMDRTAARFPSRRRSAARSGLAPMHVDERARPAKIVARAELAFDQHVLERGQTCGELGH